MSWREFAVLLRGLGPWSVTVTNLQASKPRSRQDKALEEQTPEETARIVSRLLV